MPLLLKGSCKTLTTSPHENAQSNANNPALGNEVEEMRERTSLLLHKLSDRQSRNRPVFFHSYHSIFADALSIVSALKSNGAKNIAVICASRADQINVSRSFSKSVETDCKNIVTPQKFVAGKYEDGSIFTFTYLEKEDRSDFFQYVKGLDDLTIIVPDPYCDSAVLDALIDTAEFMSPLSVIVVTRNDVEDFELASHTSSFVFPQISFKKEDTVVDIESVSDLLITSAAMTLFSSPSRGPVLDRDFAIRELVKHVRSSEHVSKMSSNPTIAMFVTRFISRSQVETWTLETIDNAKDRLDSIIHDAVINASMFKEPTPVVRNLTIPLVTPNAELPALPSSDSHFVSGKKYYGGSKSLQNYVSFLDPRYATHAHHLDECEAVESWYYLGGVDPYFITLKDGTQFKPDFAVIGRDNAITFTAVADYAAEVDEMINESLLIINNDSHFTYSYASIGV